MLNRKPLPRVSPSEVGLRADVLEEILDGLAARGEMHSLMIARHGKVCLEAFWAPYGPQIRHCLWSQTKSYTATAIGCLVDEGRLSLDEKVAELLAPYMPPEPCDNLRRMTVRDLLCMATGQHGPQNRTTPEWVKEFFSGTFTDTGKVFGYSGVVSSLLGVVLRAKTGMGLMEYMTPRVFDKIGIDAATIKWMEHPDGQEYGGGGLITGISYAIKHLKPDVKIIGVMPEGSAVYAASRAAGKLVTLDSCASIADAVVRKTGEPYLYPYIEEYVDDIVTVSEDALRKAVKMACLYAKLTLEGAAALALAAVSTGKCAVTEHTVLICSGGNIDESVLLSCLQG